MAPRNDETATLLRTGRGAGASASYALLVTEGPDSGRRMTVDASVPSRILVGCGPACELGLTDRHASRRHAALELTDRGLRLTDVGSSNGTFVDGLAIGEAFLRGGESIRVGETLIVVEAQVTGDEPEIPALDHYGPLIGQSPEMRRLYPLCARLAASEIPVLIEGETGTGKEVLAEALHLGGPRAGGPFIVFDCTAVPANLMESELFGHEQGAFTGATTARRGVFEQAHEGTLLIDEIGDLELPLQSKLLRAIERSEVKRVGGNHWQRVKVRVLSATRRDLDREVLAERFRDDLYFRIAVARIELPPLRNRRGDTGVLARHFWDRLGGANRPIPYHVFQRWEEYAWPGNVRELHNAVARQLALGDLAELHTRSLGSAGLGSSQAPAAEDPIEQVLAAELPLPMARQRMVEEFERRYLERVLGRHDGNVGKAAAASGIARRYFMLLRSRRGI
jgi:two-component system, NtrC family, response regulator HydG